MVSAVFPVISVLICNWTGGFGISVFAHYSCLPRNPSAAYYSIALPWMIAVVTGVDMLLVIFAAFL